MNRTSFKYYIHDERTGYRLQLIGDLKCAETADLSNCWRTARTTLGNRQLVIDLSRLRSIDEFGVQWVATMAAEGAVYDAALLRRAQTETAEPAAAPAKLSWFARLFLIRPPA